jgi:hypothetical protein
MSKSVSVTCICGEVFDRPIQRGRPAIWCLTCRAKPVADRPTRPVAVEGEPVDSDRIVNEHDKYDGPQRDSIEANVAAVYAEWPVIWGARENDAEADTWLTNSLRAAYETVVPGYNKDRTEDLGS